MAQIIKHRRGSLESLSAVTSSLQKGEIVIASGSSNLSVTNGSSLVFVVPENGQVQATNRFLVGNEIPNNFSGSTYNGLVKGVPYYASGSSTLYLLGSDTNEAINLVGNIQPFSTSVDSRLDIIETSLGGGGTGIGARVTNLELVSQSLQNFTASQETKDSTLATYTASVDGHIADINAYTQSNDTLNSLQTTRIDQLAESTASVNSFTQSVLGHISDINSYTASNDTLNSLQTTRIDQLAASTASVNSFSQSVLEHISDINSYTQSNNTLNSAQDGRLTSLESETSSYAKTTTGNIFNGTQVVSGSVFITGSLTVYGSSSMQNITASQVELGTNTILLNTADPAFRFGGISVVDSGSQSNTGSLFWDSEREHWIYERSDNSTYGSAILIAGPKNTGSIGNEIGLTIGHIPVASGDDHISDSIMTQSGGNLITIDGGLNVIGEISSSTINGIGNVTSYSTSVDSRLDVIETSLGGGGSIGARVTSLESFTGSQETKNSTLSTYTASIDSDLSVLHAFTASQESKDSTLATYTASVDGHIADINAYTQSNNTTNSEQDSRLTSLELFSGSQENKDSTLSTYTASVNSQLSQLIADSGSQAGRLTSLESFSGSQETKNSTLSTYTASIDNNITNIHLFTSSFGTTFSSSVDSRLDTLEGTGTIQGVGTTNDVTFNKVTTAGDVIVGGDLVVQGNTVTLNTATLIVEDKLITLASGSTSNATADGAGFEIDGTTASFKYDGIANTFSSSIAIVSNVTGSINIPTGGSSKRLAFRNTVGNIDLVTAPSNVGDMVQWDGTDFVMTNVIDGGTY